MTKPELIETLAIIAKAAIIIQIDTLDNTGSSPDHRSFNTVESVVAYLLDRAKDAGDLDNLPNNVRN